MNLAGRQRCRPPSPGANPVRQGRSRLAVVPALLAAFAAPLAGADEVLVFAAASTTNALADVGEAYEAQSKHTVKFSFASSSAIARQITRGAPAQIYLSASVRWMDYLEEKREIQVDSRTNLLANQLALVAPTDSGRDHVDIHPGFPIADLLGNARLAMGNPAHVPAGIYGKQALKTMRVWPAVKDQVARSANVRAALALVALGEAPLGIVYTTDAFAADDVKIVGIFPNGSHKAIIYPAALTNNVGENDAAARDFFAFMDSDQADKILESHGFKVLD